MPDPEKKDSASDTNDASPEKMASGKTADASGRTPNMTGRQRSAIGAGIVGGIVVAVVLIWWFGGPSQATVQRTIVTTVQQETPASTLITGRLSMTTTVELDSTSSVTWAWLTAAARVTDPKRLLPLTQGTVTGRVRVPGTATYGFDVRQLTPDMIRFVGDDLVEVRLPTLKVQGVEPDLRRVDMQIASSGWMKMFTGDLEEEVRMSALGQAQDALRAQAEARINSTNQPGINTARALQSMLTPPLQAAGVDNPRFRFRIRDDLVLTLDPSENDADAEASSTRLPQPSDPQ